MTKVDKTPQESLQNRVKTLLELLDKYNSDLYSDINAKITLNKLKSKLSELHLADIAHILESVPLHDRLTIWNLVKSEDDARILLEVSDAVRETLIADMDDNEIMAATKDLEADELADLAPELPSDVVHHVIRSLNAQQRERVSSALSYREDQVGALMDFEIVKIRYDLTLEVVLRYLRRLQKLPSHTDQLFIVDSEGILKGVLPLHKVLMNDQHKKVYEIMDSDPVHFHPHENGYDAALAFERYDFVSAPVVNDKKKLIGRLTIGEMVNLLREESETEFLNLAGLREEEDLFASVWKSVQNRWVWLVTNLVTAFCASRVISVFEGSIAKLVALATLMPIVAGIGGNSGNQTITMIVRAIALDQVKPNNISCNRLLNKELSVALINGLAWGGVIGLVVYYVYGNQNLGIVMATAITLNLLLAAFMGVLIPMILYILGKDPAIGSSVMITAITDSGGFFIFLSLATIFLL